MYDELNDDWFDENEKVKDTSMYDNSFQTEEFKELSKEKPKVHWNENQQIFMDCIDKLNVGTFHKGKFKKFSPNYHKYFVDIWGFDVNVELSNKELFAWGFEKENDETYKNWISKIKRFSKEERASKLEIFERQLVGKEVTVLITVNRNLKVDAANVDNLVKISWTRNAYGLHVFANGMRIQDYNFLEEYEKDKIRAFIRSIFVEKSSKVIYYHSALAAKDLVLIPEEEIKIEPKLLPQMYYQWDSYHPREYIDPNNPNFLVDDFGNVSSMKYTQMPFYMQSSQVKTLNNINVLK